MADGFWSRLSRYVSLLEGALLVLLLATMVGVASAQIVLRNVFDSGLAWADPLLRVLVLWVGLVGAMVATERYNHIAIDVVMRLLPPRGRAAARVIIDLFVALVCALVAYHAALFVAGERAVGTMAFQDVPAWVCQLIIPVSFAAMTLHYLGFAWRHGRELLSAGSA